MFLTDLKSSIAEVCYFLFPNLRRIDSVETYQTALISNMVIIVYLFHLRGRVEIYGEELLKG